MFHVSPPQTVSSGRPPSEATTHEIGDPDARELSLYLGIIEQARNKNAALRDLYAQVDRLAKPWISSEDTITGEAALPEPTPLSSLDDQGNPRWITLEPCKRAEDPEALHPEEILPGKDNQAGPPQVTWKKEEGRSMRRESSFVRSFRGLFKGLLGTPKTPHTKSTAQREYEGKGFLEPRRPRPLRSLFRMALLGTILVCIYTLLGRLGIVPPLL